MLIHPARLLPFADIHDMMREACSQKLVNEQIGSEGLRLYCYSKGAVYERQWTPATLMARGLILDVDDKRVVATPFCKFFNVGEGEQTIPALPFETFEKVDGSLVIIYWYNGQWNAATKGSFNSTQAAWAVEQLTKTDKSVLVKGTTYLAEAIFPENRIVIHYDEQGLVLLAAYDEGGAEFSYNALLEVGAKIGWRTAQRYHYSSITLLIEETAGLPANEEGFVIRFENGLRLKLKGEEYLRIHRLVSGLTPLGMWSAMQAGDNLELIRRELPEEFWADFDGITDALKKNVGNILSAVSKEALAVENLSDKEVGLRLNDFSPEARPFIFPYRKNKGDLLSSRSRESLFRAIRPTGNKLPGYIPSYAINRVNDES